MGWIKKSKAPNESSGEAYSENKLSAAVEELKAKVEAISELRKTDTERFTRISEEIGALREEILDKEKEVKDLSLKAAKAADAVSSLQPEKILAKVEKEGAKFESLHTKVAVIESLYQKLIEEVKEIRKQISMFRGVDEVIKLNKETLDNLKLIRRMAADVEKQADKVETFFIQSKKRQMEFSRLRDKAEEIDRSFRSIDKDISYVKTRAATITTQEDIKAMKEELNNSVSQQSDSLKKDIGELRRYVEVEERKTSKAIEAISSNIELFFKINVSNRPDKFRLMGREIEGCLKKRDAQSAFSLYNLMKASYVQLSKSDVPAEEKQRTRAELGKCLDKIKKQILKERA